MRLALHPVLWLTLLSTPRLVFSQSGALTIPASPSQAIAAQARQLSIRELTEATLAEPEATAAYSLDPLIVEAQIGEGQLHIWGRAPGRGIIVLVLPDFSTKSMQVTVIQAPPILPDRLWSGLDSDSDSKGFYDIRWSSNPAQIGDIFDYRTKKLQVHFSNGIVIGQPAPGTSTTRFPFSYLRLLGEQWKLTLLDEDVESSPISINSTVLRGAHFAEGGFSIHAGYTSMAGFQSLFLPTNKQLISGTTFVHSISANSQIGATGYFVERTASALDPQRAQGVGTVFFRRQSFHRPDVAAEVGVSDGLGGAASVAHSTATDQLHIAARYRPRHYATSDADNLNGLQSESRWTHLWGEHFVSTASGSANRIFTRSGSQTIEVATAEMRYRASNGISLSSGASVSNFSERRALFPDIRRFAVPASISYDRRRFGIGAQYEYSRTSHAFAGGRAYRGSVRWSGQHFQMNANAGLNTQALGIDAVFSAFPDLNTELARLGLGTTASVDQLATLLRDRAFLNNLGLAPGATLQLVPRNWHGGLNLSWRSTLQTLELESNYNLNFFLSQKDSTALETLRYRRGLSNSTELGASFSLLESVAPTRRWSPLWEVSIRHRFGRSPFARLHEHRGDISGRVQLQESSGTRPVQGVDITLDGERKTTSDSQGQYRFSKVSSGAHTVQIAFKSSRPFWYTTASKVSTAADSVVDFGITYASAQIVGYVLDDASAGLPNIGVLVKGPQGELSLTTDQAGKFFVPVAQIGEYTVSVKGETVPNGYALEDLAPADISVGEGDSRKVSFTLPVIRALTGIVQRYDSAKGEYVPMASVAIGLAELNRQTISDNAGRYSFRNMPAGTFTITVNGQQFAQVQFSAAPQVLRQSIRLNSGILATAQKP